MTELEWKNPPPPKPRKVDAVAQQLRRRPGDWALIYTGPFTLVPWWAALSNSADFEVKHVLLDPSNAFGSREVYARYRHAPPPPPPVGPSSISKAQR